MSLLEDFVNKSGSKSGPNGSLQVSNVSGLAMFKVDQVTLPGSLDIVSAAVKNNILFIAVANKKLLRIDLANPAEIQDLEVPRSKASDTDSTHKIHLDDTGQHLVLTTGRGDNWYFHNKLSKPAKLKVKGVIEDVAWNPIGTALSTKEILLGLTGGMIVETWLEPTEGFNKTIERYSKQVPNVSSGEAITGVKMYSGATPKDRHVLVTTQSRLQHHRGTISHVSGDSPCMVPVFVDQAGIQEFSTNTTTTGSSLALTKDDLSESKQHYAWLSGAGIFHGPAPFAGPGDSSFEDANLLPLDSIEGSATERPTRIELSAYHILGMQNDTVFAFNRFDGRKVYQEHISTKDHFVGMMADPRERTYWVYSRSELFEIVITDEAQDMWDIHLKRKDYATALRYASTSTQSDIVYSAQAQSLMAKQNYHEAADIYARTSVPVEQVALEFLDLSERDALRTYLSKKLEGLKKSAEMQRTMLATWILELYMGKFSGLDDLHNNLREPDRDQLDRGEIMRQYTAFVTKHRYDLDKDATYALINSHGRSEELLIFANAIEDHEYIVECHVRQDNYSEALELLSRHPNTDLIYATSTVLLPEIPNKTVEMWMRVSNLDPVRLLPAILMYNDSHNVMVTENQAIRYLHFVVKHQDNTDLAIHNALIGLYARECGKDETVLIQFLEDQSTHPYYDLDFALRQCKQYNLVLSCVQIYSSMGLYDQAVHWALQHDNLQLAGTIADRIADNPSLRKKLWMMIAKKTIAQEGGMKAAIAMTKKNDVLRIEDLVPHFDDFTVIDDFKDEICAALESYTENIEVLRQEMDESSRTAITIAQNIEDLKKRFAVINVGEECYSCHKPLLERQFHVFPCQHTFHSQCLVSAVVKESAPHQKRRVAHLQAQIARINASLARSVPGADTKTGGKADSVTSSTPQQQSQQYADELDDIIAAECLLCGHAMIRSIGEGFVQKDDKADAAEAASWDL